MNNILEIVKRMIENMHRIDTLHIGESDKSCIQSRIQLENQENDDKRDRKEIAVLCIRQSFEMSLALIQSGSLLSETALTERTALRSAPSSSF